MSAPMTGTRTVITGGSSGIGLATARAVVRQGGDVVLVSTNPERLAAATASVGERAEGVVVDVTDRPALQQAFERIGPFDHLFTAAAGPAGGGRFPADHEAVRRRVEVKLWGQYNAVEFALPLLRPGGSIVLMSGWMSRKPYAGSTTMALVDGGIESFARTLAAEIGPLRINVIVPGVIDTPLWDVFPPDAKAGIFEQIAEGLPVGRIGTPDDVAHAVTALMTNGFITGALLDIDGGSK